MSRKCLHVVFAHKRGLEWRHRGVGRRVRRQPLVQIDELELEDADASLLADVVEQQLVEQRHVLLERIVHARYDVLVQARQCGSGLCV